MSTLSLSSFKTVCFKAEDDLFKIEYVNGNSLIFKKIRKEDFSFSLFIMFSGDISEVEKVIECARTWRIASERENKTYAITVLGSNNAEANYFREHDWIFYARSQAQSAHGRIDIGSKKNSCIDLCQTSHLAVAHSRIRFSEDFFERLPEEFDVITPAIYIKYNGRKFNYLDLGFTNFDVNRAMLLTPSVNFSYKKNSWIDKLCTHKPYIDGGLFLIKKSIFESNRFDPRIAWNESEDLYWSTMVLSNGRILELDILSEAYSSTYKLKMFYLKYPLIYRIYALLIYRARYILKAIHNLRSFFISLVH